MTTAIIARIAQELGVRDAQVASAVQLLDEGATVPFVARYRKEATGGLDDTQLRGLEERLTYLREMEERRAAILRAIEDQGKLTDALATQIAAADSKARLEDLYLPYRQKRRTKAQIAREAGLEPLADLLLGDPSRKPEAEAEAYVDAEKGIADTKAALDGARQILMERFSEDAGLLGVLRDRIWDDGILVSQLVDGKAESGAKFSDYFEYQERLNVIPSHRALALFRGRNESVLSLKLEAPEDCETRVATRFGIRDQGRPADSWLCETARWAWKVKIHLHLELELTGRLKESAEEEAIRVFARNLRALLLQAPAGQRACIGLDPGIRTGVKVAVTDSTGKVVETATLYPHQPRNDWDGAMAAIAHLARKHQAKLVAIGNGTASRETDRLVADVVKRWPDLGLQKLVVSEAGASVYSASELAAREFPDMDVSLRGAVSIARRLQDPLAELVKIDPKAIGVGQYQHDVDQLRLGRSLEAVVEDCVNAVGVEVNTASAALLSRVAGLSPTIARNLVEYRDANGPFASRESLKKVDRLGPKAFEQAAGFLRIHGAGNPLDASGVHPESYAVVERIVEACGRPIAALMGDSAFLKGLRAADFVDERFGEPTVRDILREMEKPGRDPRPEFKAAAFKEGVETLDDLKPGMILEGVVTNVTNFGAFVDVGVHQDGLVHISVMADRFVKDPHEVVKPGDLVKVKVLEVDLKRKRVALSMRMGEVPAPASRHQDTRPPARTPSRPASPPQTERGGGALAEAFARAKGGR